MFIRWDERVLKNQGYGLRHSFYARLVESYRDKDKRPKHRILAYLGKVTFTNGELDYGGLGRILAPFGKRQKRIYLGKTQYQQLLEDSIDKIPGLIETEKIQVKQAYILTKSISEWTEKDSQIMPSKNPLYT